MKRPAKIANLLDHVRLCIETGRYFDTAHAFMRKGERKVTLPEVRYVLKHGHHEKSKDTFKDEYNDWSYAIRGTTLDGKDLRIVVAFDSNTMLIITVIELKKYGI